MMLRLEQCECWLAGNWGGGTTQGNWPDYERAQPGLHVHQEAARQRPLTFQSLYKWVQGG